LPVDAEGPTRYSEMRRGSPGTFLEGGAEMADKVKRAREILKRILKEFGPTKDHAVGAGRELLLALRSAIDAEINLLDAATKKKSGGSKKSG